MSGEVEIASESDFLCLCLDDFCEEIEVGTNEDEDQGSCSQASTSAIAKAGLVSCAHAFF